MAKGVKIFLVLLIFFIFCYFRIIPIINQTVPYTYDQGRDFLKTEEIVRYKNPTFIGPTTGIMGLYHGAWWYYFLAIPYIIFNGLPIGFSFFLFIVNFFLIGLFFFFLVKNFDFLTGFFFLLIVAGSPYLISTSNFVISSVFVIPFLLFLFYSTYQFFKTRKVIYQFLIFLSLGFVFEAEIPFGLFLIPSYIIALFLSQSFKEMIKKRKNLFYSFLGLVIPLSLRVLFEIKNNFPQTKTVLNYFFGGKIYNPHSFIDNIKARLNLFLGYYYGLFDQKIVAIILGVLFLASLYFFFKKADRLKKQYFIFNLILFISLFFTSLLYRDNFWGNYFEGLSYFYLILFIPVFFSLRKVIFYKKREVLRVLIIGILSLSLLSTLIKNINSKKGNEPMGLAKHIKVIDYLYEKNKNKDFCLRIYTPPVIPYTYDYLFSYYSRVKNLKKPIIDYVDNQCWYLIESDQYQFRIDQWREKNIPKDANKKQGNIIVKDITIELWQITEK